ncbi:GNAT family N-acetyltransferase [Peptostreptococcus equinus]|uniref:GNAT family N-acetyltransferase n=1 Tax=Peptostreptococcus equinus TaxID=3003601 RepID=A0ABY7JNL7_9FIRM|nr:GNAT family N-acetyltransferase [Peptostreptococcus sp. CBA3647]WAW14937.1 GNAT family N-acetyltransferase [Peptostreptococcus sp. CBA3647]
MEIVSYKKEYKKDFIDMNEAWITNMFGKIEDKDYEILSNFEDSLKSGGQIYFAVEENLVLAACMVVPLSEDEWEIEKFAAKGMYTGTGAGTACLKACIDHVKNETNAKKIVIVSNTKCDVAVRMYKRFGFKEIPLDREKFPYERANISLELVL